MNSLDIIKGLEPTFLQKAKRTGYVCLACGNGTGKSGDGIVLDKRNSTNEHKKYKCFKCGFYGDVVDLYGLYSGITENRDKIEACKEYFGIKEDTTYLLQGKQETVKKEMTKTMEQQKQEQTKQEQPVKEIVNYLEFYKECCKRNDFNYLLSRGISKEIQQKFCIGLYVDSYNREYCIIPHSQADYHKRATDNNKKYSKMHEGAKTLFNLYALKNDVVVITEGEIDAMSIEEVGFSAIGLGSVSEAKCFVEYLEKKEITNKKFILMLDNDEAGYKATEVIKSGLDRLNLEYVVAKYETKDANEYLIQNREELKNTVFSLVEKVKNISRKDSTSSYLDSIDFLNDIEFNKNVKSTGFTKLDEASGGLRSALYVVGAVTSLGKTTFALQIADNIAKSGNDVIFFAVEQGKLQLVTKSLSRTMFVNNQKTALSSIEIIEGNKNDDLKTAIEQYKAEVGNRMNIVQIDFDGSIKEIENYVKNYMKKNNCKPLVVVDYLQVIDIDDKNATAKEKMDTIVKSLKRLSKNLYIPIIAISALNRTNYLTPIDYESFKESGGIEYTADVIWGLQLQCMNEEIFSKQNELKKKRDRVKEAKAETPRKIELVCLKNRFGIANYTCNLEYYPKFDYFASEGDWRPSNGSTPFENRDDFYDK